MARQHLQANFLNLMLDLLQIGMLECYNLHHILHLELQFILVLEMAKSEL